MRSRDSDPLMVEAEPMYAPHLLEEEGRTLWKNRRLPAAGGMVGRGEGPVTRQYLGAFTDTDGPIRVVQRAVAADVDARWAALAGRRTVGTLRRVTPGGDPSAAPIGPILTSLAVWVGGDGVHPWDDAERTRGRAALVERLAHDGMLVLRDAPFRVCPSCSTPRNPERIVYVEEEGDTYLVRFPAAIAGQRVSLLVWVDAPWRLLGTSALLVNPEFPYVLARYRRREVEELVLTSRASLDRLRSWLPGVEFVVQDERPGRDLIGTPYEYPLRHEFPMGGTLAPPAGTIQAAPDVGDSGTGLVPLVPGHGGTDAQVAERLRIPGWPLLTARGQLDLTLMHKYAGLDLATANEFVLRDLAEEGAVFARLRVRRGVPHCSVCGTGLIWTPGRAWCLEPSRLPKEVTEAYQRILPRDPIVAQIEFAAWPVSETSTSDAPTAVALLECNRCERLEAPTAGLVCTCGGRRELAARRLLSSFEGAVSAWARTEPIPFGDPIRLYLSDRRRAPALVHHLAMAAAVDGLTGDLAARVLRSVPEVDLVQLFSDHGADAVRAALVRAQSDAVTASGFASLCVQERTRFARLWSVARATADRFDRGALATLTRPIRESLNDLEPEDRAILALWERVRAQALADYERGDAASALRRFDRFFEGAFREYRAWTSDRLRPGSNAATRRSALRTLAHLLRTGALLVAPVAPFFAESVYRAFRPDASSLFEAAPEPVDRALLDDAGADAWERWGSVLSAVAQYRRRTRTPESTLLPSVTLVVGTDETGDRFRQEAPTLARLARVGRVEVGSPTSPWSGRRRTLRAIESEIQRAYPSQASQIIHLLQRSPPRAAGDSASGDLTLVIQGLPRTITPAMYQYVESLPANVVSVAWTGGEMFIERPGSSTPGDRAGAPSPDAYWLTRRVAKRLRDAGSSVPPDAVAVVAASDPFAEELRQRSVEIARQLGLKEFRVLDRPQEAPAGRIVGRTRTGARWWVDLPGVPPPATGPRREPRRRRVRIAVPTPSGELGPGVADFAALPQIEREEAVRALGEQLDGLLGAPLLGPAKVGGAWDAGFTSMEEYRSAPFDALAGLPGFGRPLVMVLFSKLGRTVPIEFRGPSRVPRRAPAHVAAEPVAQRLPGPGPTPSGDLHGEVVPYTARAQAAPPTMSSGGAGAAPTAGESHAATAGPAGAPDAPPDSAPLAPPAEPEPTVEPVVAGPDPAEPVPKAETEPPASLPDDLPSTVSPEPEPLPSSADPGAESVDPGAPPPIEVTPEVASAPPSTPQPTVEIRELSTAGSPSPSPTEVPAQPGDPSVSAIPEAEPASEGNEGVGTAPEGVAESVPVEASTPEPESPPVTPESIAPPAQVSAVQVPVTPQGPTPAISSPSGTGLSSPEVGPPASGLRAAPVPAPPSPPAPAAGIELLAVGSLVSSLQPFLDATAAGLRGLAVVRESPERIRAHAGGRPIEVYWLTNFGRGPSLRPGDLNALEAFLERSLLDQGVSVFFLEGIEYLIRLHGTGRVIATLVEFDRRLREREARAWVHLTPDLLSPGDLEQFRAVFG